MSRSFLFSIAIAVFVAIYGGMHYYLYWKLIRLLPARKIAISIGLTVLGSSIFVVEVFVHGDVATNLAIALAWLSFTWMGLVYLFFVASVPLDALGVLCAKIGRQDLSNALLSRQRTRWVLVSVVLLASYGFYAAQRVIIEHVSLKSAKLTQPFRIVQISDLHLGLMTIEDDVQNIVDEINKLDADVIVSTGDLVDMQLDHLERFKAKLLALQARHGKYAIFGNHEMLAGLEASHAFTEQAGFTLLSNTGVRVDNDVTIIGVDDPGIGGQDSKRGGDEVEILKAFPADSYRILLKHQPRLAEDAITQFDLQLSGHTHGGQLFPFAIVTWLAYRQTHGLTQLDADTWLYVSRGTGTWGPPMRILARPEIMVFDLLPDQPDESAKINEGYN